MPRLPLLALAVLAFVGLLAAAPAHAAGSPPAAPAPFLCPANASVAPAAGAPAPLLMALNLTCGVCSDSLCAGRRVGSTCLGPTFEGYRCLNNYPVCQADGLQTCNCDLA